MSDLPRGYLKGFAANPGPNQYECAACGGIFDKVGSDEDADKEYAGLFPTHSDEPRAVVCDDCFKKMGFT
jgi:hypothetical protein